MADTFICDVCGKEFPKLVTHEQAMEEFRKTFPEDAQAVEAGEDTPAILCDTCWVGFSRWYASEYPDPKNK